MPIPTVENSTQPSLVDELARRGLLATGGNIRAIPFAPTPQSSQGANGGVTGNGNSVARPEGATPVVDENNQLIDPTTGTPLDEQSASDWWKWLLAGATGAGAAALASLLRNRGVKSNLPPAPGSDIPTVEGQVIDPLAPENDIGAILEGEYADVPPEQRQRMLMGPSGTPIADQSSPPSVAQVVEERKLGKRNMPRANPVPSSDTSVIRSGDALTDLTEEEVIRASEITNELVDARKRGNKARAKQSRFSRRAVLPTGPTDEEPLFNTVIRLMREGKIKPGQLIGAIP